MSQHVFRPSTFPGSSMDPVERSVLPMRSAAYGSEDISGFGARNEPISGLTAGFTRGYSTSIEDPILKVPQREHSVGINPVLPANPDSIYERPATQPRIPDMIYERPATQPRVPDMIYERPATQPRIPDMIYERPAAQPRVPDMIYERPAPQPRVPDMVYERPASQPMIDGLSAPPVLSNILFVDGLPTDCTRREVGHIFRPFIGFKDIKVIHKEPRRSGDKAMVLCFVEFNDAKCALTAMEALQGYKFDDKKPNAPVLKIQFAHFPFRLPSEHGDQRIGTLDSNNQATGR